MLFLPIAGLTLGVALALIDHSLTGVASPLSRSAIVIAISILAGGAIGPVGLAHAIGELRAGCRPSWTGLTEIGPMGALAALVVCRSGDLAARDNHSSACARRGVGARDDALAMGDRAGRLRPEAARTTGTRRSMGGRDTIPRVRGIERAGVRNCDGSLRRGWDRGDCRDGVRDPGASAAVQPPARRRRRLRARGQAPQSASWQLSP